MADPANDGDPISDELDRRERVRNKLAVPMAPENLNPHNSPTPASTPSTSQTMAQHGDEEGLMDKLKRLVGYGKSDVPAADQARAMRSSPAPSPSPYTR